MVKKSKTEGLEWLYLSVASFNGSGYADRSSAEDFAESYIDYKRWKKDARAVDLAQALEIEFNFICEQMMDAREAGRVASKMDKFNEFRNELL